MYLIVVRKCCGTLYRHVFIPSIISLYFASNLSNHLQRAKSIHNIGYKKDALIFASFLFVCFLFFSNCGGSFLPEGHGSRFYQRYLPIHYGKLLGLSRLCSATFKQLLAFGAILCCSSNLEQFLSKIY